MKKLTPSEKKKLVSRLRSLDSRIGKLERGCIWLRGHGPGKRIVVVPEYMNFLLGAKAVRAVSSRIMSLDAIRAGVRNKLKQDGWVTRG